MNLHSNERHEGESWPDYKARRAESKAAIKRMTQAPTQAKFIPSKPTDVPLIGNWWLGQHKNIVHNGVRLERRMAKFAKLMQSQRLKPGNPRKHVQHKHPLRDINGAFTYVGRDPLKRIGRDGKEIRRVWLAGISAQRGY